MGKVVKKLAAGEFTELSDRARDLLIRRRERKHYNRHSDMFAPDAFIQIFTEKFIEEYSTGNGNLDFAAVIKAKRVEHFYPGFADVSRFAERIEQGERQRIVETADQILENKFPIFSLGNLSYGDPPLWNFDPVHNKRAPECFYGDIDYLNFEKSGDAKVIWEVSRFQFVFDLGQAYVLTGDEKYASKFFELISAWSEAHPDFQGVAFCSALEFAIRINSLCWGMMFLKDSSAVDERYARNLYRLIYISASFLREHLSTWFSPNTHLFGEAYGLYMAGLLFPEFADAKSWEETGLSILTEELDKQITLDGMHEERSTAYHAYMLEFVLATMQLASANGRDLPEVFSLKLQVMVRFFANIQRLDGRWPHIGDEDGGRLFWLSRRPAGDYRPIMEAARLALMKNEVKRPKAKYAESFWISGATLNFRPEEPDGVAAEWAGTMSNMILRAGLYVQKSFDTKVYSLFQCGMFGYDDCPHSHADMLHVDLSIGRDNFIVDPGTFVYTADPAARNRYRSAAMHNGPHILGVELYDRNDPFGWQQRPDVRIELGISGRLLRHCRGVYRINSPLTGRATISRTVFSATSRMWVMLDSIRSEKRNEAAWRFISPFQARRAKKGVVLFGSEGNLLILPETADNCELNMEISPTEFSTDYLDLQRGAEIVLKLPLRDALSVFWLVTPHTEDMLIPGDIHVDIHGEDHSLSFSDADGEHCVSVGNSGRREAGEITTDAAFAYTLVKEGECVFATILGGSFLELSGEMKLKAKSWMSYIGLIREGGEYRVESSDNTELVRLPWLW